MVSLIDPTFPVAGIDQPSQGFRDNFTAAKNEIETLQTDVATLQANPVINVIDDIGDVDTTTTPPVVNDALAFDGINWVPDSTILREVIEDTTPQLGGDLDVNGNSITGSGIVITPTSISVDTIDFVGVARVVDDNSAVSSANFLLISNNPNDVDGIFITGRRSRGTNATPVAIQDNDEMLDISATGYDGTDYRRSFTIKVSAAGNFTGSNRGSRVVFQSVAENQTTRQTRLEFTTEGQIFYQDAQAGQVIMSNVTTDNTVTELFSNGSGTVRYTILDNSTWFFRIDVVARRTDADNESAAYKFEGVIDRNVGAASTALVGSVTKTVIAEDTAAWDVNVDADTTNGSLRIQVTGENGKTIRWVARIESVEVIE